MTLSTIPGHRPPCTNRAALKKHAPEVLHVLMPARPLATLVTLTTDGLEANPMPLLLDTTTDHQHGVLRGHVARANPLWKTCQAGSESLAIFHGDDAYVSPSWYSSKHENGKAVPTWNYVTVQAYGVLRVVDDAVFGYEAPWKR